MTGQDVKDIPPSSHEMTISHPTSILIHSVKTLDEEHSKETPGHLERQLVKTRGCIVINPMLLFQVKLLSFVVYLYIIVATFIQFKTTYPYIVLLVTNGLLFVQNGYDTICFETYLERVDAVRSTSRWIIYGLTIPMLQDLVILSIQVPLTWVRCGLGIVTMTRFFSGIIIDKFIREQSTVYAIYALIYVWLCTLPMIGVFVWYTKGLDSALLIIMNTDITWTYLLYGIITSCHFAWICSKDPQISRRVDIAYNICSLISICTMSTCLLFLYHKTQLDIQ